jgi:uncharacterized protein with von Willebrand factor type A (vWA) domain
LGPAEEKLALDALSVIPLGKESGFKYCLKTLFAKNHYQFEKFDALFDKFWKQRMEEAHSKQGTRPRPNDKGLTESRRRQAQFEFLKTWLNLQPQSEEKNIPSYSNLEFLTRKRFVDLDKEEAQIMMRLLRNLARRITHRKSRLRKRSARRRKLDVKRTVAASLRKGAHLHELIYSEPKEKKLKLVLLCDVSKSMDLYSHFFVHLVYAFQNAHDRIETFVFSTELHRVTEILENNNFTDAFNIISDRVPQWSGGTRIGYCLQQFLERHIRTIDKKTLVFILSDGWDTGEPEVIAAAMARIYKNSRKTIWLNPLAGNPGFSPDATGMNTALPFIDILAPAHNLESLKKALLLIRTARTSGKWAVPRV